MAIHLQKEIDRLKKQILTLSSLVEDNLQKAVKAITDRDPKLAARVIDRDVEIDDLEVEVEEECLKALALHQPVATDLRFIVAVLKINNDLERIGDLAVNIAERAKYLAQKEPIPVPFDLAKMSAMTLNMLHKALDALVTLDPVLANSVCASDDLIDALNRETYVKIEDGIRKDPYHIDCYINFLAVSRQLERIADHTTNIAQDVIYMIDGEIVRHRHDLTRSTQPASTEH
jgi:phosphate transport system protein